MSAAGRNHFESGDATSKSLIATHGSGHRRLRVLVVDEEIPWPLDSGKRIRTFNLLRRLARKHDVIFLSYGERDAPGVSVLRTHGIHVQAVTPPAAFRAHGGELYLRLVRNLFSRFPYSVTKHRSGRFINVFHRLLESQHFDLVQFEWTPYAAFKPKRLRVPAVITTHNVEAQIWRRRASSSRGMIQKLFFAMQAAKMERFERNALKQAAHVTAVSEEDAQQFRAWGVHSCSLVENGVDIQYFVPSNHECEPNQLIFLGALDWYPNIDAINYVLSDIWPRLKQIYPKSKLKIVGRRPSPSLMKSVEHIPGIELVGEVSDVRPHLAESSIVIVPLRIGGGSRIKILESLAMSKAVVSTSIGAEGLAVRDNEHIHIANTPETFASRCVELLKSTSERDRLGANGRKLVEDRYTWDRSAAFLENAWLEALRTCSREGDRRMQVSTQGVHQ